MQNGCTPDHIFEAVPGCALCYAHLQGRNEALRSEMKKLTGIADRANKAMEKHMKHNAALEIALQDVHKDKDVLNRQLDDLKKWIKKTGHDHCEEPTPEHWFWNDCVLCNLQKSEGKIWKNGSDKDCDHRWGCWIKSSDRERQEVRRCEECTVLEYRPISEKPKCQTCGAAERDYGGNVGNICPKCNGMCG